MAAKKPPAVPPATSQAWANANRPPGDPPDEPTWFALPLADLQAIEHHLKREMIAGQEAAGLLQKLVQAVAVKTEES